MRPCVFYYAEHDACAAKAFWQGLHSGSEDKRRLIVTLNPGTTILDLDPKIILEMLVIRDWMTQQYYAGANAPFSKICVYFNPKGILKARLYAHLEMPLIKSLIRKVCEKKVDLEFSIAKRSRRIAQEDLWSQWRQSALAHK
ncbi:MAG: hypothetical protein ACTSVM_06250 [Candidatus Ranarchaeia archaeon]